MKVNGNMPIARLGTSKWIRFMAHGAVRAPRTMMFASATNLSGAYKPTKMSTEKWRKVVEFAGISVD